MKRLLAPAALAISACAFATPVAAQDEAGERVNMVIVYDENDCPEAVGDEIVVCEILVEADRYRIPESLRYSDSPQNTAWTRRVESYKMIGAFGTLSCDAAGAGGFLGCTQQMIDAAYADRSESSKVRFSQLIAAAREERLSTIDEDAAAEQERVEQIEREYMERLERERQGPPADTVVDEDPLPDPDGEAPPQEEAPVEEPQG